MRKADTEKRDHETLNNLNFNSTNVKLLCTFCRKRFKKRGLER